MTWVAQLGNPSSSPLAAAMRGALSGARRTPASCSSGVDVTQTGSGASYTIVIDGYYNTNCSGQLAYAGQLNVTQTSPTLATATGSYTFYTPGGAVYEFLAIQKLAVSSPPGTPYFSLQASAATSTLSPPYQNLGIGCANATSTAQCSLAVIDRVAATASDNATIDSAAVSFSSSGGNLVLGLSGSGSDFTAPLNGTQLVANPGSYGFLIAGGTLVDSSSVTGTFTFGASGPLSTATLSVSDTLTDGIVTLSYNGTSFTGTIVQGNNGTQLATFTVDASGTGTVTYSDGSTGTIEDFSVVTGPVNSTTFNAAAFTCPTSYTVSSAGHASVSAQAVRRMPARAARASALSQVAVVYDRATLQRSTASVTQAESNAGGTLARSFDYPKLGKTIHVLNLPASKSQAALAALRAQAGVLSVTPTERRSALTSTPYFPSNHYFDGFSPANVAPYYESATLPGQWDMHVIGMENAFGYKTTNANALGTHSVKLAIVDSGEDPTHPDLGGNIVYQKCFITSPGDTQSTGTYSTDALGHGTDVTGIAAAVTDSASGLGFAGAGGNTGILAYRVFPTPDDNCISVSGLSDPQCGAQTLDIAAAIDDAVTQGANIISMSLGGGGCTGGVDSDPVEGAAVQNALANNVIVIAASGNEFSDSIDAPACNAGVIAVGASALDDGQPDGSGHSGGSPGSPVEYVAGYANVGSPGANVHSASAWGIVAPGGDPSGGSDQDQLHWIENIWTSTPFDSNFAGSCTDDYPNYNATTPPVDCRTQIAGTSMAAPHVAGVAALVLAVSGATYQSPSAMKTLLCSTAHDIGDAREGCGRVNAYRAVATALNDPSLPPP